MKYSQRDIVLVQFPFTDLSGSKLRPALIVSSKQVNQLNEFICIQITSRIFDDGLFYLIEDSDVTITLKLKSGIRLHKFFTVNEMLVSKKIAELNFSSFENVMKKINDKVLKVESV